MVMPKLLREVERLEIAQIANQLQYHQQNTDQILREHGTMFCTSIVDAAAQSWAVRVASLKP